MASESETALSEVGVPGRGRFRFLRNEDVWAVIIGGLLLAFCGLAVAIASSAGEYKNPLAPWLGKIGSWTDNPIKAFYSKGQLQIKGLIGVHLIAMVAFGIGAAGMGKKLGEFIVGFTLLFLMATLAFVLAGQDVIKYYNLEYAIWALAVGLAISNTVGTPRILQEALCTEFYIKTGLVLLGAEVLISRLVALGLPGVFVAWVVTPIVLITTFIFGQKILRIESPSLNMVISADMSVCGVSAAIATAAACKAKKEELSLAIGLSLAFTVIMMVVMPAFIRWVGMSNVLGGAWIGGTIDATGAVAAAGAMLGEDALAVAATIKMIQNILIGVVAFFVAVYWVVYVERDDDSVKPSVVEIWLRFPKFILGFVGASIVFSLLYAVMQDGPQFVDTTTKQSTSVLRGWFFCLAFVSIGLETNFRQLAHFLKGGKPLVLYVVGQSLNLCLTLLMAWLMFEKIFPDAAKALSR